MGTLELMPGQRPGFVDLSVFPLVLKLYRLHHLTQHTVGQNHGGHTVFIP